MTEVEQIREALASLWEHLPRNVRIDDDRYGWLRARYRAAADALDGVTGLARDGDVVMGLDLGTDVRVLIARLTVEIERQDKKHGPYAGTALGRSRLALATLEDETREALDAWREERRSPSWENTRAEVLQVAAVAIRALRDAL